MARVLNALQLALGGVGAGMSSYGRSMIDREERLRREAQQEEMNAINRLNALRSAGFGVTTLPEEDATAQAGTFSMPQPTLPASSLSPSVMGKALARATQQDMGVSERPTGTLDTPIRTALNATPMQPPTRPTTQPMGRIKIGGMELGLESPEVVARRKQEMEADLYSKKVLADQQADIAKKDAERNAADLLANKTADLLQKTFRDADGKPLSREAALYAAQSGKTPIELGLSEKPMTEAERKRLSLDWSRLTLDRDKATKTGEVGSKEQSAMQQMMVARVNVARQQARAANAEMEKFEAQLIDGTQKIGAVEAQLANEMFKDTRFNRLAEAQLNKMNPELAMYVRNAKAIGAAERLVMPRGGSNLLMNIETALAGVGPGASPELIRNTQAFRRGLVEGVQKETPEALMEAENARVESAIGTDAERRGLSTPTASTGRPPLSSFKR